MHPSSSLDDLNGAQATNVQQVQYPVFMEQNAAETGNMSLVSGHMGQVMEL